MEWKSAELKKEPTLVVKSSHIFTSDPSALFNSPASLFSPKLTSLIGVQMIHVCSECLSRPVVALLGSAGCVSSPEVSDIWPKEM